MWNDRIKLTVPSARKTVSNTNCYCPWGHMFWPNWTSLPPFQHIITLFYRFFGRVHHFGEEFVHHMFAFSRIFTHRTDYNHCMPAEKVCVVPFVPKTPDFHGISAIYGSCHWTSHVAEVLIPQLSPLILWYQKCLVWRLIVVYLQSLCQVCYIH